MRRPLHEGVDWNSQVLLIWTRWNLSPSSWGRGLKSRGTFCYLPDSSSPSSRGRGLKYITAYCRYIILSRPLHEGVDWNTTEGVYGSVSASRPLHEGVDWNKICHVCCYHISSSPSSRGRGLKYKGLSRFYLLFCVALFTRAWIEISLFLKCQSPCLSSPSSRGRGLKFFAKINRLTQSSSPSSRGRGLK